jgi:hypothetical protein
MKVLKKSAVAVGYEQIIEALLRDRTQESAACKASIVRGSGSSSNASLISFHVNAPNRAQVQINPPHFRLAMQMLGLFSQMEPNSKRFSVLFYTTFCHPQSIVL